MPEATLSTVKALMKDTDGLSDEYISAMIEVHEEGIRRYCNRELADIPKDEIEDLELSDDTKRIFWVDYTVVDEELVYTDNYPLPIIKAISDIIYDSKRDNTVTAVRFGDMSTNFATSADINSEIYKSVNQYRILRVL